MLGKWSGLAKGKKIGVSKSLVIKDGEIQFVDITCTTRKAVRPGDCDHAQVKGNVHKLTLKSVEKAFNYCKEYLSKKNNDFLCKNIVELQFSQPVEKEWYGVAISVSLMSAALKKAPASNVIFLGDVAEKGDVIIQDFESFKDLILKAGKSKGKIVVVPKQLKGVLLADEVIRESKVRLQVAEDIQQVFNEIFV